MNTFKNFVRFVFVALCMLSLGCSALFHPAAGKNTYDVTDPFGWWLRDHRHVR